MICKVCMGGKEWWNVRMEFNICNDCWMDFVVLFYFIGVCSVTEELNDGCRWHGTMDTREDCVEKSAVSPPFLCSFRRLLLIVADEILHLFPFLFRLFFPFNDSFMEKNTSTNSYLHLWSFWYAHYCEQVTMKEVKGRKAFREGRAMTFLLFLRLIHGKKHISEFIFSYVIISVWSLLHISNQERSNDVESISWVAQIKGASPYRNFLQRMEKIWEKKWWAVLASQSDPLSTHTKNNREKEKKRQVLNYTKLLLVV
jgi:hypothetical protein